VRCFSRLLRAFPFCLSLLIKLKIRCARARNRIGLLRATTCSRARERVARVDRTQRRFLLARA
jgi:hypothetical protein